MKQQQHPARRSGFRRALRWLMPLAAVSAFGAGGCATMGVNTRSLEATPIVQCYTKMGSEAEVSRSQAEGCPSCIY